MDREDKARHIGEIFLAQMEGKEIIYTDGAQAGPISVLCSADVIQYPERYSIKKEEIEKPALGIMPEYIWIEKRIAELNQAIYRRREKYSLTEPLIRQWQTEVDELYTKCSSLWYVQ